VCLVLVAIHRLHILTLFAALGSAACLVAALRRPDLEFELLPPALQSAWFVPHVVTYFFAYAGLFASFVLAALALFKAWRRGAAAGELADPDAPIPLEEAAHKAVIFGFVALTFGLGMGAAWGKSAWGDYWQWDIKENWAFVTWLAYLTYLHLRLLPNWRGRKALWLNLASFAAVMFTYLGMNLLPTAKSSLHVYQ
jgi:ABC-type transport system involved in cytochrome c biogenesis permease subunit